MTDETDMVCFRLMIHTRQSSLLIHSLNTKRLRKEKKKQHIHSQICKRQTGLSIKASSSRTAYILVSIIDNWLISCALFKPFS